MPTRLIDALRTHPSLKAAIVDLDGTMVDTLGDFGAALDHMLRDLALPPIAAGHVADMVGKGSEYLIRAVLKQVLSDAGGPPSAAEFERLFDAACDSYHRHYPAINGRYSQAYPGVAEGLAALRAQGLALACLTNKPTAFARTLLAAKGLDGFFGHVFGGDAFERKKPDPLPVLRTCEALGLPPVQVLMVGDSSNDAAAARAAGCPVVLVTYGYNHGEPIHAVDADGFIDRLDALSAPG